MKLRYGTNLLVTFPNIEIQYIKSNMQPKFRMVDLRQPTMSFVFNWITGGSSIQ